VVQLEAANKELGSLLVFLKESLSDRIEKVVLTDRLLDSPCALVTSKFGWSANMERIMRSQAMGDSRAMEYMKGRKILEINPEHEIVRGIKVRSYGFDSNRVQSVSMVSTVLGLVAGQGAIVLDHDRSTCERPGLHVLSLGYQFCIVIAVRLVVSMPRGSTCVMCVCVVWCGGKHAGGGGVNA
jgi:hypothetical protein